MNTQVQPSAQDHSAERLQQLTEALDHIGRSCRASRTQTRRIRWIEARAIGALRGDYDLHRTLNLPKDGGPETAAKLKGLVQDLRSDLRAFQAVVDAARALMDSELGEMACKGSDAPVEHDLGVLRDALAVIDGKTAPPTQWTRDNESVFCSLLLVGGHAVPRSAVDTWTDEQCKAAQDWATRLHLYASDNYQVQRRPMPEWVKAHPPAALALEV